MGFSGQTIGAGGGSSRPRRDSRLTEIRNSTMNAQAALTKKKIFPITISMFVFECRSFILPYRPEFKNLEDETRYLKLRLNAAIISSVSRNASTAASIDTALKETSSPGVIWPSRGKSAEITAAILR